MRFLGMIREESSASLPRLIGVGTLAGASSALVLAIINVAAEHASNTEASAWYLALFGVVIALYAVAQNYVMTSSASEIETILHRLRIRLAEKVRHAELRELERLGRAEIHTGIQRNTEALSRAWLTLIDGAQSAILIFFTALYLAWLSLTALVLTMGFVGLALLVFFRRRTQLRDSIERTAQMDKELFEATEGLVHGFKWIRLHSRRSAEVYQDLCSISQSARGARVITRELSAKQFIFAQLSFYFLLATMVFLVPRFSPAYGDVVIKTTTAVLFLIGPVGSLVGAIPTLTEANSTVERIYELERQLDQAAYRRAASVDERQTFELLSLQNVTFAYRNADGRKVFELKPIDLELRPKEIVFIVGGNGAGKSTLMKLLTGLYVPAGGTVSVDGCVVDESNRESYHSLFSAVFDDVHLFKRTYGLGDVTEERVAELLRLFELEGKVEFRSNTFGPLDLSRGQRKRLALLVSYLEDRPIYAFDEWAADQDPSFRKKFYEELLPGLRARGKTVIAITHDDRYFHCADRVVALAEGSIRTVTS